jgi:hypothetical protein
MVPFSSTKGPRLYHWSSPESSGLREKSSRRAQVARRDGIRSLGQVGLPLGLEFPEREAKAVSGNEGFAG